jgi:hypothetical protein
LVPGPAFIDHLTDSGSWKSLPLETSLVSLLALFHVLTRPRPFTEETLIVRVFAGSQRQRRFYRERGNQPAAKLRHLAFRLVIGQ